MDWFKFWDKYGKQMCSDTLVNMVETAPDKHFFFFKQNILIYLIQSYITLHAG